MKPWVYSPGSLLAIAREDGTLFSFLRMAVIEPNTQHRTSDGGVPFSSSVPILLACWGLVADNIDLGSGHILMANGVIGQKKKKRIWMATRYG